MHFTFVDQTMNTTAHNTEASSVAIPRFLKRIDAAAKQVILLSVSQKVKSLMCLRRHLSDLVSKRLPPSSQVPCEPTR